MTAEASALEASVLRDVHDALEPLRKKQRNLQAFMASQLERLEMLAGQLDDREHEIEDRVGEIAKQRAALDEEWTHLDALVETAQAGALEIRQEKQRLESLSRDHHDGPQQRELRRLQDELEQLTQERNVLEGELAAAQRRIGQLADVAVELAETRAELDRVRQESARVDEQAWLDIKRQLASLTEERDRLASDVKRLKHHEADLVKQHEEESRSFAEERVEWLAEIRSLRRSLAQKSAGLDEPAGGHARSHERPADRDRERERERERQERAATEDRQLDQVLDHFEAVKRDMAKLRPRKPPSDSSSS
jgi:predicted  nucleic acid-binding Zn-ribbon protein